MATFPNATPPVGTPLNTFASTYLEAQVAVAADNTNGFVSNETLNLQRITPYLYDAKTNTGYQFCLRQINDQTQSVVAQTHGTAQMLHTVLSNLEAAAIMNAHASGDSGLALMALYSLSATAVISGTETALALGLSEGDYAIERLSLIGLPLGGTVWLDMGSVNAGGMVAGSTDENDFKVAWSGKLTSGGYTVGFYCGSIAACACPTTCNGSLDNSQLVAATPCANSPLNGVISQTVSIADNATAQCQIYWSFVGTAPPAGTAPTP